MDCSSGHIGTGLLSHMKEHNAELIDDLVGLAKPSEPSKEEKAAKDAKKKAAADKKDSKPKIDGKLQKDGGRDFGSKMGGGQEGTDTKSPEAKAALAKKLAD